jgi:hypothetical protein
MNVSCWYWRELLPGGSVRRLLAQSASSRRCSDAAAAGGTADGRWTSPMLSKKVEFCLASLDELAVCIEVSVWIDFDATWI